MNTELLRLIRRVAWCEQHREVAKSLYGANVQLFHAKNALSQYMGDGDKLHRALKIAYRYRYQHGKRVQ